MSVAKADEGEVKAVLIRQKEIDRIVRRLALEVAEKGVEEELALVGIQTRGVPLSIRLASILEEHEGVRPALGTLDITLYRDDFEYVHFDPEVKETNLPFDITGRRVVLVDDVLYTGRTVRAAMDELMDFGRPARIQLLVLIDRGGRELPIAPTYAGKHVEVRQDEVVQVRLREVDGGEDEVRLLPRYPRRMNT